jgi:hypothetical protein
MLAKVNIVLQVALNGFKVLLELKIVSIQEALDDICGVRGGLSQSSEIS